MGVVRVLCCVVPFGSVCRTFVVVVLLLCLHYHMNLARVCRYVYTRFLGAPVYVATLRAWLLNSCAFFFLALVTRDRWKSLIFFVTTLLAIAGFENWLVRVWLARNDWSATVRKTRVFLCCATALAVKVVVFRVVVVLFLCA